MSKYDAIRNKDCFAAIKETVIQLHSALVFFLLAAAWVDPGRNALQSAEQWRKGRYGRMHQVVKCHFWQKHAKRPFEATHKSKRWNRKPSTYSARTAEEGSGDVRKTTPMPEKKHQHREKMASVKPKGSTYARASVQVAGEWRINVSLQCWPLIEYFVRNTVG